LLNATCFAPNKWRKKKLNKILPSKSTIKSDSKIQIQLGEEKHSELKTKYRKPDASVQSINKENKISGLSIKSIEFKKQIVENRKIENIDNNKPFKIDDLLKYWNYYLKQIDLEGKQNILSILKMDIPKLKKNFEVEFEVENSINKIELSNELDLILPYLKDKLKNQQITFNIIINPKYKKKNFYTPDQKYKKMISINPDITLLKKTFNLDL
tara:strand:- start:344 stop:979 length:636 start_codon:yes stop_codon:yes gene_type:complete